MSAPRSPFAGLVRDPPPPTAPTPRKPKYTAARRAERRVKRDELAFTVNPWGLTAMQQAALAALVSGLNNRRAAAALGVSEKTTSAHIARAVERMDASSIVRAAVLWDRLNGGKDA